MIDKNQDNGIQRRNFLKWGGASLLSLPFMIKTKIAFGASINSWRKNYSGRTRRQRILCP